ncbi:ClpP/crotonase-like domain-containing protein, partial [Roridomyces roridus]
RPAVVSSAMPKVFTAGIDLKLNTGELVGGLNIDPARNALNSLPFIKGLQRAMGTAMPVPVIIAVHGPVLGLGINIICACDIRYAAETAELLMLVCVKEVDVGLAADIGTLAYLPKITGNQSLVQEFAYTGATFSAADIVRAGFVSRVVPG